MKKSGFDKVADFYELLTFLSSAAAIQRSKRHYLDNFKGAEVCLVLGGGPGNELIDLIKICKPGKIIYLDSSSRMIHKAKAKLQKQFPEYLERIDFKAIQAENYIPEVQVDLIISHYFFDIFTSQEIEFIVSKFRRGLKPGGYWINTDFFIPETPKYKKLIFTQILRLLYSVFKPLTSITASFLPDSFQAFSSNSMKLCCTRYSISGFLRSDLWKNSF